MQQSLLVNPDLEIPEDIICPITHQIMTDPVMLVESGHTYEREAILKHLQTKKTDPLTNQIIGDSWIAPNHMAKKMIISFLEKQKKINPHITYETYLPESLVQNLLTAMEKNDQKTFSETLQKDSRLLMNNLKKNKNVLILACESATVEILEIILEKLGSRLKTLETVKSDNGLSLFLMVSCRLGLKGAAGMSKALAWDASDFQKLLALSLQNNQVKLAHIALSLGAVPTIDLLNEAYAETKTEMVKVLLQANFSLMENEDQQGNNLLIRAILDGYRELIQFLLGEAKLRVNPNITDLKGRPPLILAIEKNQVETVSLLLNHPKINSGEVDKQGNTGLHYAAVSGNKEIIRLLMKHYLSIKDKNKDGETAIQVARKNGHAELANWMQERHHYKKIKPFLVPLRAQIQEQVIEIQRQEKQVQSLTQENEQLRSKFRQFEENMSRQTANFDKLSIFFSDQLAKKEQKKRERAQFELVSACLKGNLALVKQLESQGASFSYPSKETLYPTYMYGKLCSHNKEGSYPLMAAVYSCSWETMSYIESKFNDDEEAKEQWSRLDFEQALMALCRWTPRALPERATYGELGKWYVEYEGAGWCGYYDKECLNREACKEWCGAAENNGRVKEEKCPVAEDLWGDKSKRYTFHKLLEERTNISDSDKVRKLIAVNGQLGSPSVAVHDDVVETIRNSLKMLESYLKAKVEEFSLPRTRFSFI